jgi:hypothetical protein
LQKLKNIVIKYSGYEVSLQEYIQKHHNFIITFTEIDMVYSNKKLFQDSKLLGNLDFFLDVLDPHPELLTITSEKGSNNPSSTQFDINSLFYFIENKLVKNIDYLFCDDLGNEWADFISVTNLKSFCYYHAKFASSQLSASDFQIVIGQALKNIGNMNPTVADLSKKNTRWQNNIPNTNISLFRIGDNIDNGCQSFIRTINTTNSSKEIFLVVNFLSKSELKEELINLKEGRTCPYQVIQILWLLSSFITTCKELGFNVHITCKP